SPPVRARRFLDQLNAQPELAAATPDVPTTEVSVRTLPAMETEPDSGLVVAGPPAPSVPQPPQRIRIRISISMEAYDALRSTQVEDGVAVTEVDVMFERRRCTFVSDGHRCEAWTKPEYDHIGP